MINSDVLNSIFINNYEKDYFRVKTLKKNNINYYDINKLIQNEVITRISRGKYKFTNNYIEEYFKKEDCYYSEMIKAILNNNEGEFIYYYKILKNSSKYGKKSELYFYLMKYLMNYKITLKYNHKILLKHIDDNTINKELLTNILNNNFFAVANYFLSFDTNKDVHLNTINYLIKRICKQLNERDKIIIEYIKNGQYNFLIKYLKQNYTIQQENIIMKLCIVLCEGYNRKSLPVIKGKSKKLFDAIKNNDYKLALYYSEKYCYSKNINKEQNAINILLVKINSLFYNLNIEYKEPNLLSKNIQDKLIRLNENNNICIIKINNNFNEINNILLTKKFITYKYDENNFYIKYTKSKRDFISSNKKLLFIKKIIDLYNNKEYNECIKLCNYLIINTKKFDFDVFNYLGKSYNKLDNIVMYENALKICMLLKSNFTIPTEDNKQKIETINYNLIVEDLLYNGVSFQDVCSKYSLNKESLLIIKLKVVKNLFLFNYCDFAETILKSVVKDIDKSKKVKELINDINVNKKILKYQRIEPEKELKINFIN